MSWMLESCKWKSREAYIYIYRQWRAATLGLKLTKAFNMLDKTLQPHLACPSHKHETCFMKRISHIGLAILPAKRSLHHKQPQWACSKDSIKLTFPPAKSCLTQEKHWLAPSKPRKAIHPRCHRRLPLIKIKQRNPKWQATTTKPHACFP